MNLLTTKELKIGTSGSVGYDITAHDIKIDWKRDVVIYDTCTSVVIDRPFEGMYHILAYPRSSVYKYSNLCGLANSVGVIDMDYTGNIKFMFHLKFKSWFQRMYFRIEYLLTKKTSMNIYKVGDRIGQLVISNVEKPTCVITDINSIEKVVKNNFGDDARFSNGFGSTGK